MRGRSNEEASELWRKTKLRVAPETYVLASLPPARLVEAAALIGQSRSRFAALVLEADEVSLTVEDSLLRASALAQEATIAGPYRALTLDLELELDVVGYLAPAAAALADAGISIVPQCAFKRDHLLVRGGDLAAAIAVLEKIIAG
jgi:hypothetical protein